MITVAARVFAKFRRFHFASSFSPHYTCLWFFSLLFRTTRLMFFIFVLQVRESAGAIPFYPLLVSPFLQWHGVVVNPTCPGAFRYFRRKRCSRREKHSGRIKLNGTLAFPSLLEHFVPSLLVPPQVVLLDNVRIRFFTVIANNNTHLYYP